MTLDQLTSRRTLTTLMLCIGLIQVAAYYLAGTLTSPDGSMAVPQPDTLLYCQAARRIAEGHPFSFSEGSAACTGTTSVLYPFILAIPYVLSAKGDALLTAGFVLNAFFYLLFLVGWAKAFQIWLEEPLTRLTAALLVALSGQIAFCAMAQSDIGCWLAVSGGLAAGLAMRNRWLYGSLLILGPWIRPEGMICVFSFGITLVALAFLGHTRFRPCAPQKLTTPFLILLAGIVSCVGVFALNYILTGHPQFASVANKGYFKTLPFMTAVDQTAIDALKMAKDYLFGLATSSPRDSFLIPFLAAVFMWVGIFTHKWHQNPVGLTIFMLAITGGFLTVAQSGWQGTNYDRYLAWCMPVLLMFIAWGATYVAKRLKNNTYSISILPIATCVLFSVGISLLSVCRFSRSCSVADHLRIFGKEINAKLPPKTSIGSFGGSGIAYELKDHPYRHILGIYSPEFHVKTEVAAIEILKNQPEMRFDYWFLRPDFITTTLGEHLNECCGENMATGPNGMELRKASWGTFDWSRCHKADISKEKKLVCRMDIGHEADEQAAKYETIDRYGRPSTQPSLIIDFLNGKVAIDAARLIVGGDAMTLTQAQTGKDITVVMRTYHKWTEKRADGGGQNSSVYTFANPLKMNIAIDGQITQQVSIPYSTNGFSDVSFKISGASIRKAPCRVEFLGDHIAAGYWFYQ